MPTKDPDDSLITWQTNEISPAEPPHDRADWVRIIRGTALRARVILTTDGHGRWRVSVAEETRADTIGSGPIDTTPIDHRHAVTEALRKAGKPIRD
jgi:hypothetical protein